MSLPLIVIADDFTGACDTGVQLAGPQRPCPVVLWNSGPRNAAMAVAEVFDTADRVVVDTETRHVSPHQARERIEAVCAGAGGAGRHEDVDAAGHIGPAGGARADARTVGPLIVYKKIDSTLRGNIAAEIEGVSRSFPERLIVVAPAFPAAGRTTAGGCCLVNGVPVDQTEFARDSRSPVRSSRIADYLPAHATIAECAAGDLASLMQAARPGDAVVVDAATELDLDLAARAVLERPDEAILVGSAGFAAAIARRISPGGQASPGTSVSDESDARDSDRRRNNRSDQGQNAPPATTPPTAVPPAAVPPAAVPPAAVPRESGPDREARYPEVRQPVLGLVGSLSEVSRRQLDVLREHASVSRRRSLTTVVLRDPDDSLHEVLSDLAGGRSVFVATPREAILAGTATDENAPGMPAPGGTAPGASEPNQSATIRATTEWSAGPPQGEEIGRQSADDRAGRFADALGRIAREAVAAVPALGIFVTGGDTAVGVVRALESSRILVHREIESGVPLLSVRTIVSGRPSTVILVTKAGGFGNKDTMIRAVYVLEESTCLQ